MTMQTRPVGRTDIRLSVVGFGTAQLEMLPERQAVETLARGFELGVNWVHVAPDYGGVEPWVRRAMEQSGRDVMVLSAAPARLEDLAPFFENTCHAFRTERLALYGLGGIEDMEWHGENVWGAGGMVEYLLDRKAEGRLGGLYCSTHGSADYVARLVEADVFDAVMVAWNPLGFHQQSHPFARAKIGRDYEDLQEYRERIFPLAAERGVGLLVMKPLAGGMLCKGKAFPPREWLAESVEPVEPADVLRLVLEQPGVCAVLPGCASVQEAEENALAGHAPLALPAERRERVEKSAEALRRVWCSRCGRCEGTCSRGLPVPAMLRDAYIWTLGNETDMASPAENYFDLHPGAELLCATCEDRTCVCPQGLSIPRALEQVHGIMRKLRAEGGHPGPSADFPRKIVEGAHRVLVHTAEVPSRLEGGRTGVARFLVRNMGDERWMAPQHTPDRARWTGVGIDFDDGTAAVVPLRNTVCPGELSPLVFEFRAPARPGGYTVRFRLAPLQARGDGGDAESTVFHSTKLVVGPEPSAVSSPRRGLPRRLAGSLLRFWGGRRGERRPGKEAPRTLLPEEEKPPACGVECVEHSIPRRLRCGVTYGARVTLKNTGTLTWRARPPDGCGVDLQVFVDDVPHLVLPLPDEETGPGRQATWHFPFRAPDAPGAHTVRAELAHRGGAAFSEGGVEPWRMEVEVEGAPASESMRLHELSRKHNPWYYNPMAGIARSRDGRPFPLFVSEAKGCRIRDVEGNEYLDYAMGWGAALLGHADERIADAVREMLGIGPVLPFPHPVEMEVSRMLVEDFPSNDMVVFGKNGSDVCTVAARLARLATGRRTILSCGFHGWQDFALDYFAFEDCGIPYGPERRLHKFVFNDREGFLRLYDRLKDDLAAVMIEPAGPLIDDEAGLGSEADPEFLGTLADAARRAGALLVFDEIVTGFRYPGGSVQKATGIVPDLTCLGKSLASGMPLAALLGPYRIFLPHFHKTHFCPTFKGELYSLAAAKAAMGIYRSEPVAEHVWRYGEALRRGIHELCEETGVEGRCTGPPFRMLFVFREPDAARRRLKRTLLVQELFKEGVVTVSGMMLPGYAHDAEALRRTLDAFAEAFRIVARADRRDDLHAFIEIPLL